MMLDRLKKYLIRRHAPVIIQDGSPRTEPVSRSFGVERGKPIDRFYIESFLAQRKKLIHGDVLEISEDIYTRQFGSDVRTSSILTFDSSAPPPAIFGDLTKPRTLPINQFDCFIATQTLNFIADVDTAIASAAKLLRPSGVFLGTVAALSPISQFDYERWGDYWRFTDMGLRVLLTKHFARVTTLPMGNLAAVKYFLDGLAVEDIPSIQVLEENDPAYSAVIGFEAYLS